MKSIISIIIAIFLSSCGTDNKTTSNFEQINSIAFGSCAKQWEKQPIWSNISKDKPNLFLFLGDAIYGDWDGSKTFDISKETLKRDYNKLGLIPEYKKFKSNTKILATWDNHDYGKHNGGREFEKKHISKEEFLNFFNVPKSSDRYKTPGIYDSKIYGPNSRKVQIILLDTRWFKSPFKMDTLTVKERLKLGKTGKYMANTDPNATLLGDTQWKWLKTELKKEADVRFICSSTQVIPNQKGMDEWGNYPIERSLLLETLSETTGTPIILSGNVHFAEISRIKLREKYIYEFTSSGLTHVNEIYGNAPNKFRVLEPFISLNYGLINIDWNKKQISFKIRGLNEHKENELSLSFN